MGSWVGGWRPTGHPSPDTDGTGQCPSVHFACSPGASPLSTWFTSAGHIETHVAMYLNMGLAPARPASSSWGCSPSGCIPSVMATVPHIPVASVMRSRDAPLCHTLVSEDTWEDS